MTSTGPSDRNACRIVNQNSCGSGSICGEDSTGTYVLTNAHVAGTRVGRKVRVDIQQEGVSQPLSKDATVVMAGYSDRTQTDWAVLRIAGWSATSYGIKPVKLSKQKPSVQKSYYTKGSPRCVWPLRSTDITPVDMQPNMPLWRWRPNSIGGQSGSGVYSDENNLQYGLLTWSWGGLGAGQQTAEIYRQARDKTTSGLPRVDGLEELAKQNYDDEGTVDRTGLDDPIVEEGLFAQAGITDLPIWHDPSDPEPEPEPEPEPNPDTEKLRDWFIEHFRRLEEFYMRERKSIEEVEPPLTPDDGDNDNGDDTPCDDDKIFGL